MVIEKNLLLSFLAGYDKEAVEHGLAAYDTRPAGISITAMLQRANMLSVPADDIPGGKYNVSIMNVSGGMTGYCTCSEMKTLGQCRHVALAVIYLLVRGHSMSFNELNDTIKQQKNHIPFTDLPVTNAPPHLPSGLIWKELVAAPQNVFDLVAGKADQYLAWNILYGISIINTDENKATVDLEYRKTKKSANYIFIHYDRHDVFHYACDCNEKSAVCQHVNGAFAYILQRFGRSFFVKMKDWTEEKKAMLKPYGIEPGSKEAEAVGYTFDNGGNLQMQLPTWLWKEDVNTHYTALKQLIAPQQAAAVKPQSITVVDFETGFLFNMVSQHFKTGFELEVVKVVDKNGKVQVKKLGVHQKENLPLLKKLPRDLYSKVIQLSDSGMQAYMAANGHNYLQNYSSPWGQMTDAAVKLLKRRYMAMLQDMWPLLCGQRHIFMLQQGTFSNGNIRPVSLSAAMVQFSFAVTEDDRYITITLQKELDGNIVDNEAIKVYGGFLFEINGKLHLPAGEADIDMLQQFEHGYIKIPLAARARVIKDVLPLLQRRYTVHMPATMGLEKAAMQPAPQILLKELDNKFLVLQPQYIYGEVTVDYEPEPDNILQEQPDGTYKLIIRDTEQEQAFFDSLRLLHPRFEREQQNDFFFLPFDETMKQNWFVHTIGKLVESNIPVLGMQDLKKHKYNTNKPKWEMKAGSGIDWFDLQIEITFGDQAVSLRDVRKALLGKQNMVVLGDGTFGVLPEEWLKQYGLLLKMGQDQKDGSLRVSKLHYTLIDELHSQIDDETILQEINDKKQRLSNIGSIAAVKPGKAIKAKLRPYQVSGFQWFHMLDELGWGGCLADDMGLGKTLQTITFLAYLKEKYAGSTHLVICPTSLIYNWEAELQKFAPSLKYHIYYGLEREFSEQHFQDYDVIITSYGIIRNDLEELMKFSWHYIFLDESQAIKNPEAQTNKALQLLTSKNRMILSGTPVQNNTFDLFAQFNFINPGLLGNREFFKTEFANPIDKNNDAEKGAELRRLIYPFMLRRTKEQVAKDLPDKTETILWCEMGKKQRKVYDEYKNYYRTTLIEKIEEVGMAKAGMYVLEGLLRLRQICDSPQLVKDSGIKTTESVKTEELLREIEQNAGGHKLLVFSQFTEMLHLLEENLQKQNVSYVYLDGSTPAEKRKDAVNTFQTDASVRVFLISLKAGGVGLNLTAADYVYIVDPWWNPAVEQQAIDRTHRIGQVNKIFAYKMICKDTVEEKIVQLQQRKKQLANDLVTEDAGFIKKLTKDDVAFLFS